ncbi:PQ-loop repeat-containing protein 3 [Cricetulus griseus]|nr:PQ-loop repeat-containing protein 3 [Cricetulus griseus]
MLHYSLCSPTRTSGGQPGAHTVQNLSTVISVASKFAQLQYLWKVQDSGAVSALTWGLSSYTCAILIRFVVMLALNIWVTITVLRYRKPVTKAE